jgi:hypothetical protein
MDHSIVLGADPSPLAALLRGSPTGSMRPRRALPSGRLDTDHRPSDPFAGPNRDALESLAMSLRLFSAPVIALALALSIISSSTASVAQPASSPGAETSVTADQQARAHFQRGQELANLGKYPQAYLEFEAGYRQSHRPLFLFNLGEAARAFGDSGRARAAYERYLEEDPEGPMVASARSRLSELPPGPATDLGLSPLPSAPVPPSAAPAPAVALVLPAQRLAAPPPPRSRPLWKKWPVWAAVGGVVVGGVAFFALTRDRSACGGGCTVIDLRPGAGE